MVNGSLTSLAIFAKCFTCSFASARLPKTEKESILLEENNRGHVIKELIFQRQNQRLVLRDKCTYSYLFWSVFSHIRTEYG